LSIIGAQFRISTYFLLLLLLLLLLYLTTQEVKLGSKKRVYKLFEPTCNNTETSSS
jgi:hypothetical protein